MNVHVDERADGSLAFYLDGDLQFDTHDEALYHEALALPALCLARRAYPDRGLRVLICGGGDGLALRECLRFPGVEKADLVDRSAEVLQLARSRFRPWNEAALDDPRTRVHERDAWAALSEAAELGRTYDVVICDFTVPRCDADAHVFTREWYELVGAVLDPDGFAALNAVSPQTTPGAFWCLTRTVRAAGLSPLPYRVCIPSFRAQGFGVWGFLLASQHTIARRELRSLRCPVPTRQADFRKLRRAAQFSQEEQALETRVPVHAQGDPCLLPLLLNPEREKQLPSAPSRPGDGFSLERLLAAVPVLHPYQTRLMVESLAEDVAGSVRGLDLCQLVEALLARARELPGQLVDELRRLRDYLQERLQLPSALLEFLGEWGARILAILILILTLANSLAPDNAFAKSGHGHGSEGGHSSSARGFGHASEGHSGDHAAGQSEGTGSRSHGGGVRGGRVGGGFSGSSGGVTFSTSSRSHGSITGRGFRTGYGERPVDILGNAGRVRYFEFSEPGAAPAVNAPIRRERAWFAAADDMLVLENGDVAVTLSEQSYLLVSRGHVSLMANGTTAPLFQLYPDPGFLANIRDQLVSQRAAAATEAQALEDWLSWAGWTSSLYPVVGADRAELTNLRDLDRRLDIALSNVGNGGGTGEYVLPPGSADLFMGCVLQTDRTVALLDENRRWHVTDGRQIWLQSSPAASEAPAPPSLGDTLRNVMQKLQRESTASQAASEHDLRQLEQDRISLERDLAEYSRLYEAHGRNIQYEVDYGTDSITVGDALGRTRRDLRQNQSDRESALADLGKTNADLARLAAALGAFRH